MIYVSNLNLSDAVYITNKWINLRNTRAHFVFAVWYFFCQCQFDFP